jgi:hypothetical protein
MMLRRPAKRHCVKQPVPLSCSLAPMPRALDKAFRASWSREPGLTGITRTEFTQGHGTAILAAFWPRGQRFSSSHPLDDEHP